MDRTMKRSKFSEEQILAILREQEAGGEDGGCLSAARCQQRNVLRVEAEVRRHERVRVPAAEALEAENAKLKRLLADAMLDNTVLKVLVRIGQVTSRAAISTSRKALEQSQSGS
jgi:putative transposase